MRHARIACLLLLAMLGAMPAPSHATTTVYLNRCVGNCQFAGGPDDSVANTSTVLSGTATLTAFAHGDAAFAAVVDCAIELLRPFDIVVTTTDPSPSAHTEVAIAGTPQQAGLPTGVTAIAPFTCLPVSGAPAFVFANSIGNAVQTICWGVASQVGAMAALEPLFNCSDVMSYLPACGPRTFRNEASSCGTFSASACFCGGTTRNSFSVMRTVFGVADALFASGFE
jgi:hypothetical protein